MFKKFFFSLAAVTVFAAVTHAEIIEVRKKSDLNPTVSFSGIPGDETLSSELKRFLSVCGWFDPASPGKTADYTLKAEKASNYVNLYVYRNSQKVAGWRFHIASNPRETAKTIVDTVIERVFEQLKVRGFCHSRIAFCAETAPGIRNVFFCDIDGGNIEQVTNYRTLNVEPCWSPSGKSICFSKYGKTGIDVVETTTAKPRKSRILSSFRGINTGATISPDSKYMAVIQKIKACYQKGQPVLVGTTSIEKSELLSALLKREGGPHQVLNAKHHEKEAAIVAQAGQLGTVTIATNMAGRGTDIMLGGNPEFMAKADLSKAGYDDDMINEAIGFTNTEDPEILEARTLYREKLQEHKTVCEENGRKVREAGGLCILGTERHESRRIDNQLRGRAGRQGDPGESTFYLSLEDDLMRLFGSERIQGMFESLGVEEDMPIEHKMLSGAIENAQKKVEGRNFLSRKSVLEYDNVMSHQRDIIYKQRADVLDGAELKTRILNMIREWISQRVNEVAEGSESLSREQIERILRTFSGVFIFPGQLLLNKVGKPISTAQDMTEVLTEKAMEYYEMKEQDIGSPVMRELERVILLKSVDQLWMDHIDAMHELRRGIGLNAYAQVSPIEEYKRQGMDMFDEMIGQIRSRTARLIFLARIQGAEPQRERVAKETSAAGAGDGTIAKKPITKAQKVGRNDLCPCGSGLKYKKCCGKNA